MRGWSRRDWLIAVACLVVAALVLWQTNRDLSHGSPGSPPTHPHPRSP